MNPLPTNVLVASEVKKIIAVNVLQSPDRTARIRSAVRHRLPAMFVEPFYVTRHQFGIEFSVALRYFALDSCDAL